MSSTPAIYRAATVGSLATASTTTSFFVIPGSATRTVLVRRIIVSGLTTATLAINTLLCRKLSSAPTGGTATDLVKVPLDSASIASTLGGAGLGPRFYTAAPTDGTVVGSLGVDMFMAKSTTVADGAEPEYREFNFVTPAEIYLRGIAEHVAVSLGTAVIMNVGIQVEWQEIQ